MSKFYVPPKIEVQVIDFESKIAAGSAIIKNGDPQDIILEEWESDTIDRTIDW